MSRIRRRAMQRRVGRIGTSCCLAIITLAPAGPVAAQSDASWVPAGYEEHARAAWAVTALLCGSGLPDQYVGSSELQELCADTYASSVLWLGMALAWTQLPSSGAGGDLQIFPTLEPELMERLRPLAASARPTWNIVADENLVRAPDPVRRQLLDTTTRTFDIQLRTTIARARLDDPEVLLMDEPVSGLPGTPDADTQTRPGSGSSSSSPAVPSGPGIR